MTMKVVSPSVDGFLPNDIVVNAEKEEADVLVDRLNAATIRHKMERRN